MKTLIISGGNIDQDFALDFIGKLTYDRMIVADRGLEFVQKNHIKPDLIVGDFDSVNPAVMEDFRSKNDVPIRTYNPVKDATDTQITIEKAIEDGSDEIWVLGATGTRIDHVLGNICCLQLAHQAGVAAYLVDSHNRISLVSKEKIINKDQQFGNYISLIPLCDKARGVSLKGFKYSLDDVELTNVGSLGISNEILEAEAEISVKEGVLILVESKD